VCLNGAAARLVQPGDRVIVITYADYEDAELDDHEPRVVHVDTANRPVSAEQAAAVSAAAPAAPGPVRYVDIAAELASLDDELGAL
jgi:aspartate 1-decarboxylase